MPYNFNKKENRPFVGILFEINDCMYFAHLSSPKPKHLKIKANMEILKLDSGKLGVINFNNTIPVTKNNIIKIDLNGQYYTKSDKQYNYLLKDQLTWLNRHSDRIYGKSQKLYDKYINGTLYKSLFERCCNFPLLEEKCLEYNKDFVKV